MTPRPVYDEAKEIIYRISKCENISEFQGLDNKLTAEFICKFKQSGIGVCQISRLIWKVTILFRKVKQS